MSNRVTNNRAGQVGGSTKSLFQKVETVLSAHPRLVMCMTLLACALLIISRRPEAILHAQFWAEDGKYWFADAYNLGLVSILVTYGGYFVVVYRLVASLSQLLPLTYVPLFFNLWALCFQLLPVVLMTSSRLRHVIPYKTLGIALSLLYVSVPNSSEVFLNLSNIQWHLGIAAFFVLIAAKSSRLFWKAFDISVLVATGLAGPLIIMLLPIAGYLWRKTKSSRHKRNFITVAILSGLQVSAILFISGYERVGGHPDASVAFIKMIVGQVFTASIFGELSTDYLYGNAVVLVIVFGLVAGVLIYVLRNGPLWLKLFNIYGVLVIGSMLASLRPAEGFDVWEALTRPAGGQRYWYIPMIIWLATLIWLAFKARFKPLRYMSVVLLLCLVLVGVPRDWKLKPYTDFNFPAQAQRFERSSKGSLVAIPINPGWYMYLTKK